MTIQAIVSGIGESEIGKVPDKTEIGLILDAALAAIADAGLEVKDVDGLILHPPFQASPRMHIMLAENLGIYVKGLADTTMMGGASDGAALDRARVAVESGQCRNVLILGGSKLATGHMSGSAMMASVGAHNLDFEYPFGATIPSYYGLLAQRYFDDYGADETDLAAIAVSARKHAMNNPRATMRTPITVEDVVNSPIVSTPLHRLDCSLVSDGAGAFVVSAKGSSATPEREIAMLGIGQAQSFYHMGQLALGADDGHHDLVRTVADVAGRVAFDQAGLAPKDIDLANIYDSFTITVAVQLEDLGFCSAGEAGAFVKDGNTDPGGILPMNPHGGLLSNAHPGAGGGMFGITEAIRQLRGEAHGRQVEKVDTALASCASAVASNFSVSIFGRAA